MSIAVVIMLALHSQSDAARAIPLTPTCPDSTLSAVWLESLDDFFTGTDASNAEIRTIAGIERVDPDTAVVSIVTDPALCADLVAAVSVDLVEPFWDENPYTPVPLRFGPYYAVPLDTSTPDENGMVWGGRTRVFILDVQTREILVNNLLL